MRFKLDENIPRAVGDVLRAAGHVAFQELLHAVSGALALLASEPVERRLWIVERSRVRVRE